MATTLDPVREFLRERGAAANFIEGGLPELLLAWEQVVQSVEGGYLLDLDDYLNDMDVRQLIEDSLSVATDAQRKEAVARLEGVDEQMRAQVEPISACLWGEEVAHEEGWTAKRNWWYFSRPIDADPELLEEIENAISGD